MRKRKIALVCVAALLMTGCGATLPEMTDEQVNVIGEYAAITLLKYDANSRSRLVDLSQIEEKEDPILPVEPESLPTEDEQPENPATPVIDHRGEEYLEDYVGADSVESFLELPEGISVIYSGYETCQSYEEEGSLYLALEASEGKELLVLHFTLQNTSGANQEIDLIGRRDNYRVTINGSYTRAALTTMLTTDLSTYMGTVPAGGTEEVVLLVEIDPEQVPSAETISLNLKNDSKTYTIQLL